MSPAKTAGGAAGPRRGELLCLGISYRAAPVALRERAALSAQQAIDFALALCGDPDVHEAVVISTCNRTELYLVGGDPVAAEGAALAALARHAGIRPTELAELSYSPRNCDAARQLFRVTAGLDSMILGEHEVQGQVKRAYESALAAGTTGPLTNRLFTAALHTGKRVRHETALDDSHVSLSSVAVDLAESLLGELKGRHVVIIGAGETSELTAQALAERGLRTIFVANRHADRARSMAERFGGEVVGLDHLPDQLTAADIVLASTASPHPIVGYEELELVMRERAGRPLLLIDIAVPRDIEPACGDLDAVTLRDIDDLQSVVARNLSSRAADIPRAEAVVADEIDRFAVWLGQLDARPTIAALRERSDQIVAQVLADNVGRWESASEADLSRIAAVASAVAARLLHEPTLRLKALDAGHAHGSLELLRDLFGLDRGSDADVGESASAQSHDNV
ncbi:MAG TPA: glutamyl-tRNA reductase, partial [Solirubrobacteraceae bacterium]|nr:glutamyl-tRNA reductase [Solirubrobacteraceae bacterium]